MFSSLTLRNCAFSPPDQTSLPITLTVSVSFPASRRTQTHYEKLEPTVMSWAALLIADSGHLDLTLDKSKIGEGLVGLTYAAHINTGTDTTGQDILAEWPSTAPRELCVKIAKPQHCRTLAREAWFYEQLRELQGIATARCYGFYTVALAKEGIHIRPWKEANPPDDQWNEEDESDDEPPTDRVADDWESSMFTDEHGFKKNSPWNKWRPSEEEPLLAVLVLEKLGRHYYFPKDEMKVDSKKQQRGLRRIVQDIAALGVIHCDLTAFNFLLGRNDQTKLCPRHNVVHRWRIIDFHCSNMIDPTHCAAVNVCDLKGQSTVIGKEDCGFWGGHEDD